MEVGRPPDELKGSTTGSPSPPFNVSRSSTFRHVDNSPEDGAEEASNPLPPEGVLNDQLYRRLDEGIAATLAQSHRWDRRSVGRKPNDKGGHSHGSIFEKYRENLLLDTTGVDSARTPAVNPIGEDGGENEQKSMSGRRFSGDAEGGASAFSRSPVTANIHSLLLSDAEAFIGFTMSHPPNQQLLQVRVLELFQVWLSNPEVMLDVDVLLQEAKKRLGVEPVPHQPWSSALQDKVPQPLSAEETHLGDSKSTPPVKAASPLLTGDASETKERTRVNVVRQGLVETSSLKRKSVAADGDAPISTGDLAKAATDPPRPASVSHRGRTGSTSARKGDSDPVVEEKGASYDEIPRFYFPLGRPTTKEKVLTGPMYPHHLNPQLKAPDDVALVVPGESPRSSGVNGVSLEIATSQKKSNDPSETSSLTHSKISSMSTLRFADDRHVRSHIRKEFSRLGGGSKHGKSKNNSSSSSSRRANATSPKEAQRRSHFIQCIQRICTQCFGVPRYFSFIIIGLIQAQLVSTGKYPNLTGSLKGGLHFISPQCYSVITGEHVQSFYDQYLKNKDTLRRTFDLLILSSRLTKGEEVQSVTDLSTLRAHILGEDFKIYLLTLLCHHPGLLFLRNTPEFQSKYMETVIFRIFYEVDRFDLGRISFVEFCTSPLLDAFRQVDASDDINSILHFFSYEHFYVLYCRFWELDEDRDMLLSPNDLMGYSPEGTMNPLVIERVFAGAGRELRSGVKNRIGYEDFVWFCLSEEDKQHPTSIRYWFKILDLDADGVLSMYELKVFYDATAAKVVQLMQENELPFDTVLRQVYDMLRCNEFRPLKMSDLVAEPAGAYVALNMLTSIIKFLQFEFKDPFVMHQERLSGGMEQSRWDRFARAEYDRMSQEGDG